MDAAYLSSYLPRLVRRHLARADAATVQAVLDLPYAAVLLTDMQGFTRKVDEAAAGGRNQLDRFTRTLDAYFCDLIDTVHARGGDVLAFAGDSMLCAWPCDRAAALREVTLVAAEAGMQIQKQLAGRELTRVGLGAGRIDCTLAGGCGGRWELFATGEALGGAAEAERQGLPGQVVLAPAAWSIIANDASAALLASGCYVLGSLQASGFAQRPVAEELALPAERLRAMVPDVVMHHVGAGQAAWLSEVRPVSVMVVGLPELDLATPQGLERGQCGIRRLQEIVRDFGGSTRCVIDGKGPLIAGDFGLPPASPERHAERAVRAARSVHRALAEQGIACGIGVATARAVCMGFGNAQRRDFGVFGDGTIVATRLMQSAGDSVWCDEVTARAAAARLAFTRLPALQMKGRDLPVRVYRPDEAAQARTALPAAVTLVGRVEEQARIAVQLDALQQGRGGLVLIDGEAGSGKSTLLAAMRGRAGAQGLRVLQGEADVVDRATPYLAWRPIFSSLLEIEPGLDGRSASAHILARFAEAEDIAEYLPLLGPALGLSIPETERTRALAGEVRAANTHRTLRTVLDYFARRAPLLITIEDAHWLDSGSIGFLRWIARRPGTVLCLVSTRPEQPFIDQLRARLRGPQVQNLSLGEMPVRELFALARQTLEVDVLPPALETVLRQNVGGNPYFCTELLRALLDSGRLRIVAGRCEVQDLQASDLPATVESVILGRLSRLGPAEQFCLKAAAVLGPSFREETLQAIHPVTQEREHIAERLEPAARGGLIAEESRPPDRSWSFRHAIVRDTTYALWTQAQRQPLHHAVARWYETRYAQDLAPLHALLAHHWDEAGAPDTAADYLERAGTQALRDGAYQEAGRLFGRTLELLREDRIAATAVRRARWHSGLGMAHYYLGELDRSQQQLEAAVALLDRPIPGRIAGVRRRVLSAVFEQTLHRVKPARYAGRRAQEQAEIETAVECYSKLSQIYYLNGEPTERLLTVTLGGLNLAEQGRPSAALARVLAGCAVLASLAGLERLADSYAHRAQALAAEPAHREAAAQVWHFRAILCAQRGHWAPAREANDRALGLMRELSDQTLEAEACVVRSTFLLCQSEYREAEKAWSRALLLARRAGNPQVECWCLLDAAEMHLGRGDLSAASQALDQALLIPTRLTDGYSTLEKHRVLAMVRLRQQRPEEALAACDAVYAGVHSQPPAGYHWADFYASAVEVILRLLERRDTLAVPRAELLDRARQGVRMLEKLARRFGNVRVRARILAGLLEALEARPAQAMKHWREAIRLADALAMPGERARAVVEWLRQGQVLDPAEHARSAEWLREAGALELLHQLEARTNSGAAVA